MNKINRFDLWSRVHDDIIVNVVVEEECVMVKISKLAEYPMCTKNRTRELYRVASW